MRHWVAALAIAATGSAGAEPLVTVRPPAPAPRPAAEFRLNSLADHTSPALRIDDPASRLRSGYGGSMVDLFPFEGGNFHLSGGPRLFGRAGRPRSVEPENLRLLPGVRGGPRLARRFTPALLVGYGRTVERGLALGIDAGLVMGRIMQMPDRVGRFNRGRLDAVVGRARLERDNALARMTALYRF